MLIRVPSQSKWSSLGKRPLPEGITRLLILLAGIFLGQVILYGPSLVGETILLPLDILAERDMYLPQTPEVRQIETQDPFKLDPLELFEPARRFAASEWRTGRLPMWAPYQYAGVPFTWPKFSPFLAFESLTSSPVVLAWGALLRALVAGIGMYVFARRVLEVGFWPAAICAWCYPLTAFFVFWQGFPTCGAVYWLPWMLLAVDKTVRRAHFLAPAALAVGTCLVLLSGHLDVAGQVLLVSGFYAIWRLVEAWQRSELRGRVKRAILALAAGWALGFLLAAPYILPTLDYARTGARLIQRAKGTEERPPTGLSALPQVVLPSINGSFQNGSLRLVPENEVESSAAAYSGLVATMVLVPLAWCSPRHRRFNFFWLGIGIFGLGWCLNIPGVVQVLRLPGLNLMSHNRLVFAVAFAILALTATGLETVWQDLPRWRWWFWIPVSLLAGALAWCLFRAIFLPDAITTKLEEAVQGHKLVPWWMHDLHDVRRVQLWFIRNYLASAVLCSAGLAIWLLIAIRKWPGRRLFPALGVLLVADVLWFAFGRSTQCDPALYFPPVPVLQQVSRAAPGRVIGVNCLPASFAALCGLEDIRGYDGIDPANFTALMKLAADPRAQPLYYAQTQWLIPQMRRVGEEIRLSPILDMLNVRYVILRGSPPPGARPAFQGPDYWVLTNAAALPRIFVPHRVESVPDEATRLRKLGAVEFDPREVAYVESPVGLAGPCQGEAALIGEDPTRITVSVQMKTPGLVVLADLWDKGWHASWNGKAVPILRTNHALRGVLVPAGSGTLEFSYWPPTFTLGLVLCAFAIAVLAVWAGYFIRQQGKRIKKACKIKSPGVVL